MQNTTLGHLRTPPPTHRGNNSDDVIIDTLIYLFALLCADNQICSSTFRFLFGAILEGSSALVASIPVMNMQDDFASRRAINFSKGTMLAAWVGSNIAGYKTYKSVYKYDMEQTTGISTSDKYEASSDAFFSYAIVTFLLSAAAACVFTGAKHLAKKTCGNNRLAESLGYNRM